MLAFTKVHPGRACEAKPSRWRVWYRKSNYSAQNGYRCVAPSVYSRCVCLSCGASWRTKAAYVDQMQDASPDEIKFAGTYNPKWKIAA